MTRAALLSLAFLLPALADEPPKPDAPPKPAGRKKALKDYQERMKAERETLTLGGLEVTITLVNDHFVYQMVEELLKSEDLDERPLDSLKEQVGRMAERRKGSMGKPALLVRFSHPDASRRNFHAFEGKLDDVLRVRVGGSKAKVTVGATTGDPPRSRNMTLFRPSKSAAYGGGNVAPTMRVNLTVLPEKPFTVELVLAKPPNEKAKELEVAIANLIHFSGGGITDDQVDFDNGASAEHVRPSKAEWALPLKPIVMPPELRELMPEWKGE